MLYVQMFWAQKSLGLGLIFNKINNEKLAMQKKNHMYFDEVALELI